jgi:colanic acid biosynthesis glycosyl transferase WcaI
VRILFLGLNYAPEQIGIAVYSTGLCEELAARGHQVHVIAGKPYYPEWRIYDGFRGGRTRLSVESGVHIRRVPHYVPADPTGGRRIIHHASFALSALLPALGAARAVKPDVVMTVAPSLIAAPVAALAATLTGAKSWLHIQDFEVEAGFATGLVDSNSIIASAARLFERSVLRRFDRVSSISHEMCRKADAMIAGREAVFEFRNWARIAEVRPLDRPSVFRERWGITTPHVALYSGNIANKQGLEVLVEAARLLAGRSDLTFVVCGNGPNREKLESLAQGLPNIRFHDLQPIAQLQELMGLATMHLLPQKAGAADLVLPSKLANMLASGRPVIATADPETGLSRAVAGCGLVTPPEDARAFATAIERLIEDPELRLETGSTARKRAESDWGRGAILDRLCRELEAETTPRQKNHLSGNARPWM